MVNVVYNTDQQNISTTQINSQIAAMNKDFRATNPDRSQTPDPWKGLVSDARIQFKLVKVTRTRTSRPSFTHDDGVKRSSTGGIAPFSPKTHLNLWVCPLSGGLLGYAQFPGGPVATEPVSPRLTLATSPSGAVERERMNPISRQMIATIPMINFFIVSPRKLVL